MVTGPSITTIAATVTAIGIQAITPTTKGGFGYLTIEAAATIKAQGMTAIERTIMRTTTTVADRIKQFETDLLASVKRLASSQYSSDH